MIGSLRNRLILVAIGLVLIAQGASLVATLFSVDITVRRDLAGQMAISARLMDNILADQGGRLFANASVLADDFGFKRAVSSDDEPTVASAVANHGQRVNADLAAYVDREGHIVLGGEDPMSAGAEATLGDVPIGTVRFVRLGDRAVMVAAAPVKAPLTVGALVLGREFDDDHLDELASLVGHEVSLVDLRGDATFSSLEAGGAHEIDAAAPGKDGGWGEPGAVFVGGDEFIGSGRSLSTGSGEELALYVLAPLSEALAPYQTLELELIAIAILVLLLAVLLAVLAARAFTRPVERLVLAAERVEAGDYDAEIAVPTMKELAVLGRAFNNMQRSIAERQRRIVHEASHDPLTDLPNRSSINSQLPELVARAIEAGIELAVVVVDIRRFSQVNDAFGHGVGDELLVAFTETLRGSAEAEDTIARIGSDEFMVVLPGRDEAGAIEFGRRLQTRLLRAFTVREVEIQLKVAVGVLIAPRHGKDAETLFRRGDIALMLAKQAAEAIAVYAEASEAEHLRKLGLTRDLARAIDEHELDLHLQVKTRLAEGDAAGAEALVRWTHPQLGPVSPAEFIPLAEQAGSVSALTRVMLNKVVGQLQSWASTRPDLSIALNLSALDLADVALMDDIRTAVQEAGVEPGKLTLEITESAVAEDFEQARAMTQRLRDAGFRISIDDFGTGQSSLAQLQGLPVHELKLDRAFVQDIAVDAQSARIVKTVIELAHDLGLEVVAEGIEDEESLAVLRSLGCEFAQGFYIHKPARADMVDEWLDRRQGDGG